MLPVLSDVRLFIYFCVLVRVFFFHVLCASIFHALCVSIFFTPFVCLFFHALYVSIFPSSCFPWIHFVYYRSNLGFLDFPSMKLHEYVKIVSDWCYYYRDESFRQKPFRTKKVIEHRCTF